MIVENFEEDKNQQIIAWVNQLLKIKTGSLTHFKNCAIFCQILDIIYEGRADIQNLNWNIESDTFDHNFEILKQIRKRFQIKKEFLAEKIKRGDGDHIYSILQWLRIFSGTCRNFGSGYDPVEKRKGITPQFIKDQGNALKDASGGNNIMNPKIAVRFDPKTVQKLAQFDLLKSERDFYFSKLKDIDHVLDVYKDASVESLTQTIKEVLYLPPEKISIVTDTGQVVIKGGEEDTFDQKENINANFIGGGDTAALNFGFDGNENLNLLSDSMDIQL